MFSNRKNWQSAASSVRKHARQVYDASGLPLTCVICGYAKHADVSHVRDVASFPDAALIMEINALSNLAALCRNCHWELDHRVLSRVAVLAAVVALHAARGIRSSP